MSCVSVFAIASQDIEEYDACDPEIQALTVLKVLSHAANIGNSAIDIAVINAPDVASELKKYSGKAVGAIQVGKITECDRIPSQIPKVVYVGKSTAINDIVQYCRKNRILSICGSQSDVRRGVSLGVGLVAKKLRILVNTIASNEEGVNWNPAFLKIVTVVRS